MIRFLVTLLLLLFTATRESDANSNGAGGCAGGMAAVGGYHLDTTGGRQIVSGTLAEYNVVVQIGTTTLVESVVNDFPIGQDITISVSTVDAPYTGILVRLEAPMGVNTDAALLPVTNTAIASACMSPIIGITHTNKDEKSISTGTIRFDKEVFNVVLDATLVYYNDATLSLFAYSAFKVNFRGAPTPVTPPVVPPTPVTPPVVPPSPVTPPVVAPTPVSIPSPTPPVTAPVAPVPGMGGGGRGGGMTVGMGGGGGMGMRW